MDAFRQTRPLKRITAAGVLLAVLCCLISWARADRLAHKMPGPQGRQVISIKPGPVPVPIGDLQSGGGGDAVATAAEDLRAVQAAAASAKDELDKAKAELQTKKLELQQASHEASKKTLQAQKDLDKAREALEKQRAELEAAAKEADTKVKAAKEELARLEEIRSRQVEFAAARGVAQGFGRGRAIDFQTRPDPRRYRSPDLPPFAANPAAVAAAGASPSGGPSGPAGVPAVVPPGGTVYGDAARGNAMLLEAQGNSALRRSQAAINVQTAGAMNLENRLRWTETFFEMRRVNRTARALEAGPTVTMEQAIKMAVSARPPRPTSLQLDPITGDIRWPVVLADPLFHYETNLIEQSFRQRAEDGGSVTYVQSEQLLELIDTLSRKLKENVAKYPAGKYGAARTFLDSLKQEYEMPVN